MDVEKGIGCRVDPDEEIVLATLSFISISAFLSRISKKKFELYRAEKKSWYMVARNFFLLLLNFSAWPCLGAA